jgi:nitrite reductase (NADH) large subunit
VAEPQPVAVKPPKRWRCLNCSYVHSGPNPPDVCPVCGAPADCFEPVAEAAAEAAGAGQVEKVVIVGAGVAGVAAAEAVCNASPGTQVTLLSKEQTLPYYRLNLTRYLAGDLGRTDLPMQPDSWYAERDVDLRRGVEVCEIDVEGKQVKLRGDETAAFDKLILTVGAHPFTPAFPGAYREGVTSLRTVDDAERILETAVAGARCVCIGGGLLGLETAGALAKRGVRVTLLEGHGWLLPRQLNATAGRLLGEVVRQAGIELRSKARTREILGDEAVRGVQLEDETVLPAGLVVIATGVRPNSYLARLAGLEVNRGVVVDNVLRTSHGDVLAAGDVAEHRGVLYGTWAPAQYQGNIAGMNAVGAHVEFGGIPRSNALKVLQVELFSIGQVEPEDASFETIEQEDDGVYTRFVFRDSHLVGSVLLGDATMAPQLKRAIESRSDFSRLLQSRPSAADTLRFIQDNLS